jgi:hypothetical protein
MDVKLDPKDKVLMKEIQDQALLFKERLIGDKTDSESDVFKAVRTVVAGIAVVPKKPKLLWLSELKTKDLEPAKVGEATLAEQMSSYYNAHWGVTNKLSTVNSLLHSGLFGYWAEPKPPQELLDTFRDIGVITQLYIGRVNRLVNQAKTISGKMYNLNKKSPIVTDWRTRNYYSRSVLPLRVANYPKVYALGKYYVEDAKTTLKYIKACETIALNLYSILFINNKLILVEKPVLHIDSRNFLHREDGPAIYFPKLKSGIYCMNDVRVSKQVVVTPAEKLKAEMITKTRNAEIRRELVRKIGIERVLAELGATLLDKSDDGKYELVNLAIDANRNRPYLKMLNPSTGTWHIEGVEPRTTTVAAALQFRNGTNAVPIILT